MFAPVPRQWKRRIEKLFYGKREQDEKAGNLWLLDLSERFTGLRVPIDLSDGELIAMANQCAREALDLAGVGLMTMPAYRERLNRYCGRYGLTVPQEIRITKTGKRVGVEDGPAIRRMTCPLWWRRALRKAQGRALEREAVGLGYVHRRAEIYASDATVHRRTQQKARNALSLESTDAVNLTTGEIYTLAELAARAVSNPEIRRGELMTRIAGFEAIAQGVGDAAEFVTLTAPSAFHAQRQVGPKVEPNPSYSGATPRETQSYLVRVWARVRAALARVGVRPYGFRIAEPHHDATPHWHLLLFMAGDAVAKFREVFRKYALQESPDEPGAQKNRIKFVSIDPAKGSAAGYIAKYVSKNIEGGGYQVQKDVEGHDAIYPSQRVEAWASTWGIRQFQQIGGPPVGVWRELRRMPEKIETSETVEAARAAADAGNWRRYVEVQGGPVVKRDDLPLRTAYTRPGERFDVIANEPIPAPETRYGETAPGAVYGVRDCIKGRAFVSRVFRWEIRRGGVQVLPRVAGPWTGVNNCTEGVEDGGGIESNGVGNAAQVRRDAGLVGASGGGCGAAGSAPAARRAGRAYRADRVPGREGGGQ